MISPIKYLLYKIKLNLIKRVAGLLYSPNSVIVDFNNYLPTVGEKIFEIRPGYMTTLSISPEIAADMNNRIISEAFLEVKNLYYCELDSGYIWTDHSTSIAVMDKSKNLIGPVSFAYVRNLHGRYIHGTGLQNKYLNEGPASFPLSLKGSVVSLLSGGGSDINFYHWHMDILSRLFYVLKYIDLKEINYFLLPQIKEEFQIKTLEIVGIPLDKVLSKPDIKFYQAERLITISHPRTATFEAPLDLVKGLRSIIKRGLQKRKVMALGPQKVYLSRAKAIRRKVLNEKQVIEIVKKYGYQTVYLEDMTFDEILDLFSSVESVISPHGAGILNTLYSDNFKLLIEVFPYQFVNPYYEKYTYSMGARYYYIKGSDTGDSPPMSRYEAQNYDILVNLNKLEEIMSHISN